MRDWYRRFYTALPRSEAYAEFCVRAFGEDLGQHGFADMDQVQQLVRALDIRPADRLLDIGCGPGGIVAGIAADTGAHAVGVDYVEQAVALAVSRYAGADVDFVAGDIDALCFAPQSFDCVMGIDALYFTPPQETLAALSALLRPGGRMGFLYSHGADPEHPLSGFDRNTLPPQGTPLGIALAALDLPYTTVNLTEEDRRHALRKKAVLQELETRFISEGNEFLFENRYGEANGVLAAIDAGAHARYLYVVHTPGD